MKKGVSKTTVRRTSTSKVGTGNWRHISGRAKLSMIEGYLIDPGSGNLSKKKSSSSSISSKINSYKSKIEKAKREALGSFVVADRIISKIYGGYVAAKSKLKRTIYKYFSWIGKFPASLIWSVIASRVLKGVDWLLSRISRDRKFKSLISVAYNMLKAGKSSWELALALIGWGVTKFASSILRYFGNFANWVLSKFGSVGSWLKKLIKGWVDPAMSFVSKKLAYFEKKLRSSLSSIAAAIGGTIEVLVVGVKSELEKVFMKQIDKIKEVISSRDIYAIFEKVSKFASEAIKAMSIINQVLTTINVVQAMAEIATAGIGAVVTRILIPLVAAVVVNEALPYIAKHLTKSNLDFSFSPITVEDVISIVTGGFSGLIEFIVPRIISVSMIAALIEHAKTYNRDAKSIIDSLLKVPMSPLLFLYFVTQVLIDMELKNKLVSLLGNDDGMLVYETLIRESNGELNQNNEISFDNTIRVMQKLASKNSGGSSSSIKLFKAWYVTLEAISLKTSMAFFTALAAMNPQDVQLVKSDGKKRNVDAVKTAWYVILPAVVGTIMQYYIFKTALYQSGLSKLDNLDKAEIISAIDITKSFTVQSVLFALAADSILELMNYKKLKEEIKTLSDREQMAQLEPSKNELPAKRIPKLWLLRNYASRMQQTDIMLARLSAISLLLTPLSIIFKLAQLNQNDADILPALSSVVYVLDISSSVISYLYAARKAAEELKGFDPFNAIKNLISKLLNRIKGSNNLPKELKKEELGSSDIYKSVKTYSISEADKDAKRSAKILLYAMRITTILLMTFNFFTKDTKVFSLATILATILERIIDMYSNSFALTAADSAVFYYLGNLIEQTVHLIML